MGRAGLGGQRGPCADVRVLNTLAILEARRADIVQPLQASGYSEKEISDMMAKLHKEGLLNVSRGRLADADHLVSAWSYMIQESEPLFPSFNEEYAARMIQWILEPIRRTSHAG